VADYAKGLLYVAGALTLGYAVVVLSGLKSGNDTGNTVLDWWNSLFSSAPVETRTSWCQSLGSYIDPALTCPNEAAPVSKPTQPDSWGHCTETGYIYCTKQEHCIPEYLANEAYCDPAYVIPGTDPIIEDNKTGWDLGLVGHCHMPNGDLLTVPIGMDCRTAVDDMCQRFASVPGYKGCS
jgi:hypothetical protein